MLGKPFMSNWWKYSTGNQARWAQVCDGKQKYNDHVCNSCVSAPIIELKVSCQRRHTTHTP